MIRHLPYLAMCAASASGIGYAAGWPWGLAAGALFFALAAGLQAVWIITRRRVIGDDIVTIFCRCCDADPALPCTCIGDCGRRWCQWATNVFTWTDAERAALLGERELPR